MGFWQDWKDNMNFYIQGTKNFYTYYDKRFEGTYAHEKMYFKDYYFMWLWPQVVSLLSITYLPSKFAWGLIILFNLVNIAGAHIAKVVIYRLERDSNRPVLFTIEGNEIEFVCPVVKEGDKFIIKD